MPRAPKEPVRKIRWRLLFELLILGGACVGTAAAALKVRRYALTDPQFTLSRQHKDALVIEGARYASRQKILHVFAGDFEQSIFAISLSERRRRLLAIDWVEEAAISRIWPDRLVVRIRERTPVAFVFFPTGVLLIDSHGVLLDPPPQAQFTFPVLSGIREDQTESQRRDRVACLLRIQEELGASAKDLSEVNASDPDNIRIVVQVEHRTLELIMGDANFGKHYHNFVTHYQDIQKSSPGAKTFDLRLDDRITAGE